MPLGPRALELILALPRVAVSDLLFPGCKGQMSDMTLAAVIRRMNARRAKDGRAPWADEKGHPITIHGFRATFRTWVHQSTDFGRELAEEALGHKIVNAVEEAYVRGDALERRRQLMVVWERYLDGHPCPCRLASNRAEQLPEFMSADGSADPTACRPREVGAPAKRDAGTADAVRLQVQADGRLVPSSR